MLVKDFAKVIEDFAPKNLAESYDNVGLQIGDANDEIKGILVSLDATNDVVEEAKAKGCNLIYTHHPLLYRKPSTITSETLLGRKIMNIIKANISLYSAHTNLDSTQNGITEALVSLLGYDKFEIMEVNKNDIKSGVGRIVTLENSKSAKKLIEETKEKLNIKSLKASGDLNKEIRKIAFVNGSGEDYLGLALKLGADAIITGDTTYHYVSDFTEEGLVIIDAGHFATEWITFKKTALIIEEKLRNSGFDLPIHYSEVIHDPYNFI